MDNIKKIFLTLSVIRYPLSVMNNLERIRVASLQYFIRPVESYERFQEQVTALVETAADYKCHLLVFPEYFTTQLLTLGDIKKPIDEQVRDLAKNEARYVEMFQKLAKENGLYVVGGTIPSIEEGNDKLYNKSYIFSPNGKYGTQGKLHMTRFEREEWNVSAHSSVKVFETDFGRVAIAICYDVEFPEITREAARRDANILIVPSCTDDRQGFLRVRYCAHARAIENQIYVVHSSTVGSLPQVPAVSLNYGQASILTPSDFAFSRDGILAEGNFNQEMMVLGELNLKTINESRSSGTVLPLNDSKHTKELISHVEVVSI